MGGVPALPRRFAALTLRHLRLAPNGSDLCRRRSVAISGELWCVRLGPQARFSKLRRDATTVADKAHWAAARADHLSGMIADRRVDTRLKGLARMSFGRGLATEGVIYLTVDGMDQAKFKAPRNLDSSKEFDGCWRPQLHLVGALVPGLLEAFFGMNADVPADSNLTMTVVARALHHVSLVAAMRGVKMPEHFVLLAPSARLPWCWRSQGLSGALVLGRRSVAASRVGAVSWTTSWGRFAQRVVGP